MIVIFQVVERPTLEYVKFVGNQAVRTQTLRKKSELEKGQPLDPYAVEEARRRVEAYYHESGYNHIQITTIEGDKPNDRERCFWSTKDNRNASSGSISPATPSPAALACGRKLPSNPACCGCLAARSTARKSTTTRKSCMPITAV